MNYEAAILYAKQRMREIGKLPHQYHFEPVRVVGTAQERLSGYIQISAYNELYIMINPNKYYGVAILSDNSSFQSEDHSQTGIIEYTGMIHIKKIADYWNLDRQGSSPSGGTTRLIPFEFLRVVIY